MKGTYLTIGVTVLVAGVLLAIMTGEERKPSKPPAKEPAPVDSPSPVDPVEQAPDARALAEDASQAEKRGDLDRALALYDKALALGQDRDVAAARERVKAAMAERQKTIDAAKREDDRKTLLAEAARLEQVGRLDEAKAKYQESLELGEDPLAREAVSRIARLIMERAEAEAKRQTQEKFDRMVTEARSFQASGEFDKAVAKYEEALGVLDDASIRTARDEAKRLAKMAERRAKWGFVPRGDELDEDDWDEVIAAGELFLAAWADRDDPDKALDARRKEMETADAAYKALPDRLKKHPAFQFLNGAQHFLLAMGIYDDFLVRRDALLHKDEKVKLQEETIPVYNGELTIANLRLKAARDATDGHFAACFLEALSRAWRSDAKISSGGKRSLAEVYQSIEPLTPFDDDVRSWHARRGLFREK